MRNLPERLLSQALGLAVQLTGFTSRSIKSTLHAIDLISTGTGNVQITLTAPNSASAVAFNGTIAQSLNGVITGIFLPSYNYVA